MIPVVHRCLHSVETSASEPPLRLACRDGLSLFHLLLPAHSSYRQLESESAVAEECLYRAPEQGAKPAGDKRSRTKGLLSHISQYFRSINEQHVQKTADLME
jgi:hypothetical protein